jgi:WD40 repeat protein
MMMSSVMPVRLFLSYARDDDEPFVARLCTALATAGFEVWFDRASMPSRQLTFHQEIRDAVTACDRLILIIGPNAITSDYVTQEWRFAYFEAVKCVNPIVRLDGAAAARKKIDGYSLIPGDLRLIHAEDFRDDSQFDAHLVNLIRQLNDPLTPAGKLVAVPELPPHYLDQPARLAALRDILLADLQKPVVVSGARARVGLQGMGGIGKSVLASALAHRPEVRRAFPDGVFWVTLGQEPNVADLQHTLAHRLGDDGFFAGVDAGKEKLRELLSRRSALLVLDDVWQRGHAEAFNVLGPCGRLMLTTRDAGLVTALATKENHYQVQLPTEAEAAALLAKTAGVKVHALTVEAREVVGECGRLPLGLALCGGMVHGGRTWQDVLVALREHDLEYLSDSHPAEEQHGSIWKAMDVSIRALPEPERERFAELAVFALDTGAPEAAVETLWGHTGGLSPRYARDLLMNFRRRSLIDFDPGTRRMSLHDLLHNFATGMTEDMAVLHRALLAAYRKKCEKEWSSGPDDGYFLQTLCRHLLASGEVDDAIALLTGLDWIVAKCRAGLVLSLQQDFRDTIAAMPETQEGLRNEARRKAEMARWTHTLKECAEQGRRPREEEIPRSVEPWREERIRAEVERIKSRPTRLDKVRVFENFVRGDSHALMLFGGQPGFVVQQAYNSADSGPVADRAAECLGGAVQLLLRKRPEFNPMPAVIRTLAGHNEEVFGVEAIPMGQRAVSVGRDRRLRLWDLESGACIRILQCQEDWLPSELSVSPDGRRAITGGFEQPILVWDLERGVCLDRLAGKGNCVTSLSVAANGRQAVSCDLYAGRWGNHSDVLQVWDLESSSCIRSIVEHSNSIHVASMTSDGRRAVSGGSDGRVLVWDLETGQCLKAFEGHRGSVTSLSVTSSGQTAVSASDDETLIVWDLGAGARLRTLNGHRGRVNAVDTTPDGRLAVSGGHDQTVRLWDLQTGSCLRTFEGHRGSVNCLTVTFDGRWAISGAHDDRLLVWNLESGLYQHGFEWPSRASQEVSVTPNGRWAVSAGNGLRCWDLKLGGCPVTVKGTFGDASIAPDGRQSVTPSYGNALRVWDLKSGRCLRALEGHLDHVTCVSVTQDGRRALSGSEDHTIRLWDVDTGVCLRTMELGSKVLAVSVTPDGRRGVSASLDHVLRVWDLETGLCLTTLGIPGGFKTVIVTPDGRNAVSGSWDGGLRVWRLDTAECLRTLDGHFGSRASITPDGRRIVSGSNDKTLRIWDLETGACLAIIPGTDHWPVVAADAAPLLVVPTPNGVMLIDVREP